ncbi:MAG: hypothetical protein V3V48_14110, partial [Candidatus Aminicenantaceae bacterium]
MTVTPTILWRQAYPEQQGDFPPLLEVKRCLMLDTRYWIKQKGIPYYQVSRDQYPASCKGVRRKTWASFLICIDIDWIGHGDHITILLPELYANK